MKKIDPLVFDRTDLRCGGQAICQHDSTCEYVKIGIVLKVGSLSDPPDKQGLCHLFEHFGFEGTDDFPSNLEFTTPIESHGGMMNALTGPNFLLYWVMVPVWQSLVAWHALEQLVWHFLLDPERLEAQKRDVEQEMARDKNDFPPPGDQYRLRRALFGRQLSKRMLTLGRIKTLQTITVQDVQQFHQQYFLPSNMFFIATGNLNGFRRPWPEFVERKLAHFHSQPTIAWPTCDLSSRVQPIILTHPQSPNLAPRFLIGGRIHQPADTLTVDTNRMHRIAVLVEHILIDGGQSSILHQELREKKQLTYDCTSNLMEVIPLAKMWTIDGVTKNNDDLGMLLTTVADVVRNPTTFTPEKVQWAKQSKMGHLAMMDQSPSDKFDWVVRFLPVSDTIPTKNDFCELYQRITVDDVLESVRDNFNPDHWVSVVYSSD